ncbi:hypothetical protein V1264_006736 [Littorina saxatilis]
MGDHLETSQARSPLACFARCSLTAGCVAVSVCPREEPGPYGHPRKAANCTLFSGVESVECNGMIAADSTRCFSARKDQQELDTTTEAEVQTTTELTCQNGGHVSGSECWCPPQYGGSNCERLVRDCSEPYNRGFGSPGNDGVYNIQPLDAPNPFQVLCELQWGGSTIPFLRSSMPMPNSWSAFKNGFGDDLTTTPSSQNFFAGMENLHYLTSQANYNMQFVFSGARWCGFYFDNFRVANENSSYSISYSVSFPGGGDVVAEDGFHNTTAPLKFSTSDRNNGCTVASASAGWYDVDCKGFSPFADVIQWPTDGGVHTFTGVKFALGRIGDFFEG